MICMSSFELRDSGGILGNAKSGGGILEFESPFGRLSG